MKSEKLHENASGYHFFIFFNVNAVGTRVPTATTL